MDSERYASVTRRCLEEDLGLPVPDPQNEQRARLDHPLIENLCRIAPDTPRSQKAVESLHDRGIRAFHIRHADLRGCTLHLSYPRTEIFQVVWLVAAGQRRGDSADHDVYEHFVRLADGGQLMPTEADWTTVAVERLLWLTIPTAIAEAIDSAEAALDLPGERFTAENSVSNVTVVAEVVNIAEEGLADLLVAFYHPSAATAIGNIDVHVMILKGIADHFGFHETSWRVEWDTDLDQTSLGMYVATFEI